MSQFQPPSQTGWGQPEQQQWPQQPSTYMPIPPTTPPPYTQPGMYYPPGQQAFPPQYPPPFPMPQPLPPPFWQQPLRPVRANIKIASIVCFVVGTMVYFVGGIPMLSVAGLLNLAGFILIFFI